MGKIKYGLAEPYLYKHPNGIYYACWRQDNKNRRKSLRTEDEALANRRFRNFKRDLLAGRLVSIETGVRKKLYEFTDELLAHKEATTSEQNAYLYEVALDKAKTCWKDIPLQHITGRHIDTLILDMARKGLKPPTINKNIRHIKGALSKAYEWDYINKPLKFPKPLEEEEVNRYFTLNDLKKLFDVIDDLEFADLCLLSAYSALRSGELLRLKKSDIDNPTDFLRISSKQKNKTEARVPINKNSREILSRCLQRSKNRLYLFQIKKGAVKKNINKEVDAVSKKFKAYARKAGLEKHRFHDLRHTFGSHMAMMEKGEKTIQELMRHKSSKSTAIYMKLSPQHLKGASEDLNYGLLPVAKKDA